MLAYLLMHISLVDHARLKEHVASMSGGLGAKINEGGKFRKFLPAALSVGCLSHCHLHRIFGYLQNLCARSEVTRAMDDAYLGVLVIRHEQVPNDTNRRFFGESLHDLQCMLPHIEANIIHPSKASPYRTIFTTLDRHFAHHRTPSSQLYAPWE